MSAEATVAAALPPQDARTVREQVRQSVERTRIDQEQLRTQIREAVAQSREAAAAQGGSGIGGERIIVPPPPPSIRVENGRVIVGEGTGPSEVYTVQTPEHGMPVPPDMIRDISMAFFMMVAFIAVGVPLIKLIGRILERRQAAPAAIPADVGARLDRIEQAVEAVAIEVERISEGQRFTSRLISELRSAPQLERVTEKRG